MVRYGTLQTKEQARALSDIVKFAIEKINLNIADFETTISTNKNELEQLGNIKAEVKRQLIYAEETYTRIRSSPTNEEEKQDQLRRIKEAIRELKEQLIESDGLIREREEFQAELISQLQQLRMVVASSSSFFE